MNLGLGSMLPDWRKVALGAQPLGAEYMGMIMPQGLNGTPAPGPIVGPRQPAQPNLGFMGKMGQIGSMMLGEQPGGEQQKGLSGLGGMLQKLGAGQPVAPVQIDMPNAQAHAPAAVSPQDMIQLYLRNAARPKGLLGG